MSRYKAYSEYKDSGLQWLGDMPSHWALRKSKYIFNRVQREVRPEDGVVTAFRDGQVTLRSNRRTEGFTESIKEFGYQGVRKGDLLVHAMDGFAGAIGVSDSDGKCSPVCSVCVPTDSEQIHVAYFGYLVRQLAVTDFISSLAKGIRERSTEFRFSEFSVLDLALPTKNEQAYIASFLDHETAKIDALIEKQQRLIELLKEKRQAVISHAVTKGLNPNDPMKDSGVEWLGEVPAHWHVATARRFLLEHKQGYYSTEDYVDDGVKLLRITDLRDLGEIDSSNSPRVKRTDALKIFLLRKGDVVFARTGGAGSFGVIPDEHEDLAYASYLIRFRFAHIYFIYPYLRFMFASDNFQQAVKKNIHGGVNQNLHAEDIKNTFIAVPLIEEQERISTYLSRQSAKYSDLITKAESAISLLQERRTALISAAVTGKIDVRDWQAAA